MTDQNALKRAVAAKALEYVKDGMKLGLGSGSTAEMFVEMLAPRVRGGAEAAMRADQSERPPRWPANWALRFRRSMTWRRWT